MNIHGRSDIMNFESSPFRPGQPVPLEFFVGRIKEIERLHSMVKASIHQQRLTIGFTTGERRHREELSCQFRASSFR